MGTNTTDTGMVISPSQWLHAPAYLACAGSFLLLVLVFTDMVASLGGWSAALIFLPLLYAAYKYAEVRTTRYRFTGNVLVIEQGVFDVTLNECPWWRIRSIRVERPLLYRIIGLSNIYMLTSDNFNPSIAMPAIHDAAHVLAEIQARLNEGRRGQRVQELDIFDRG